MHTGQLTQNNSSAGLQYILKQLQNIKYWQLRILKMFKCSYSSTQNDTATLCRTTSSFCMKYAKIN